MLTCVVSVRWAVRPHVVILAADRLLDERLVERLAVDRDRIVAMHRERAVLARLDLDAELALQLGRHRRIEMRSAVPIRNEPLRRPHADLVEHAEHDASVPEDLLTRQVITARSAVQCRGRRTCTQACAA